MKVVLMTFDQLVALLNLREATVRLDYLYSNSSTKTREEREYLNKKLERYNEKLNAIRNQSVEL